MANRNDNTRLDLDDEQTTDGPVECLGMTFPSDDARREHFLEILREKLQDPEFRSIEGFPIGEDEDILALSDPPYYTACPNPFIEDFIEHYGTPYDPKTDDYHREPLAADVSEGKNDTVYRAHSYHTKVPPKAIMRYLLRYTEPGDIVFDGFCGTGMTGVAARECGNPAAIEDLGYRLADGGAILDADGQRVSTLGARRSVLCDLSVLPTFIATNLNGASDPVHIDTTFETILSRAQDDFQDYFMTENDAGELGWLHYLVWSDVFLCPGCSSEVSLWDASVDLEAGVQADPFPCPACGAELSKRTLERARVNEYDPILGAVDERPKRVPVLVNYEAGGERRVKTPSSSDIELAERLASVAPSDWVPIEPVPKGDRFFKDGLHLVNLHHYHRFYFPRTLHVLARLWGYFDQLERGPTRNRLRFILTSMLDRNLTIRNRFVINRHNPTGRINGPLANTLYVPGLSVEQNPFEALAYKSNTIIKALSKDACPHAIATQSTTDMSLPENCLDYVFVDPPFGHNIMYSELNGLNEAWLRVRTADEDEAVVSEHQEKDLQDYMDLMLQCFSTCYRALKPGRWMTVEFHNSQNAVWNAIQEAVSRAGFVVADVRTLDKRKGTINQEYYSSGAVKQDLIISAYKPNGGLERRFELEKGTEAGVWDFVRTHVGQLAPPVMDGQVEILAERQDYLLYDRMVAFHVQRGVTVPLSAAEFYAGLRQRFPERDGMFFLPEQVAEYDRKRMQVEEVQQPQLIITDESSAIQWLRQQLREKPQSFQDLQPEFMQQLQAWEKHEEELELSEILKENFLRYDGEGDVPSQIHSHLSSNYHSLRNLEKDHPMLVEKAKDRWYVPDPNKEADLEKIRHRALMREFEEYRESKGKLKTVRTEALRAGFKECWQSRDYQTIVDVAKRLPDEVVQEDSALLMYYDNALVRTEG